jgi:hypothetical protein
LEYLNFRSSIIQDYVSKQLQDRREAKAMYEKTKKQCRGSGCKIQMNKQKGEKRHPSYLVNTVNLIAASVLGVKSFDDDPQQLAIVRDEKGPITVLSKRMDGAFPSVKNPRLLWEVKEYYGTTTFGSRISDGVYETMLVGFEIAAARKEYGINLQHVLFVDDRFTWWTLGRSYICRIIDMMHMGNVDAVFFGKEATEEWQTFLKTLTLPSKQ